MNGRATSAFWMICAKLIAHCKPPVGKNTSRTVIKVPVAC